jgi:hypothetical protein
MTRKLLILFCVLLLSASGAQAATHPAPQAASSAEPDPMTNPVLSTIEKAGAKLYYMGNREGMDGWFIIKDGQVQMVYSTPDNKGALIGALFGQDGENITTLQVQTLAANNKEVATLINSMKNEEESISVAGNQGTSPAGAAQPTLGGMPSQPLSPGERLLHDLSTAATIVVGVPSSPEVLMVMDMHCLHCQAAWRALRDAVFKGSLHIRMIPIGDEGSDSERAGAIFLNTPDPLNAWDKYVAGDHTLFPGAPSQQALSAVRSNHAIIDAWGIHDTPYLVYRAKDGKVKIVDGEPEKVSLILGDMGL